MYQNFIFPLCNIVLKFPSTPHYLRKFPGNFPENSRKILGNFPTHSHPPPLHPPPPLTLPSYPYPLFSENPCWIFWWWCTTPGPPHVSLCLKMSKRETKGVSSPFASPTKQAGPCYIIGDRFCNDFVPSRPRG